jgi:hypothetical protein
VPGRRRLPSAVRAGGWAALLSGPARPKCMADLALQPALPRERHQQCLIVGETLTCRLQAICGARPRMEDAYTAVPFLLEVPVPGGAQEDLIPPRIAPQV